MTGASTSLISVKEKIKILRYISNLTSSDKLLQDGDYQTKDKTPERWRKKNPEVLASGFSIFGDRMIISIPIRYLWKP
jgi:hypothetical protein